MEMEIATASASASAAAPSRPRIIVRLKIPPGWRWAPEEDDRLRRLVKEHGLRRWNRVADDMPGRSTKQCRDRWRDVLARDMYHRPFTARDDAELLRLHHRFGGRWHDISRAVYGRSAPVVKRRWRELRKTRRHAIKICPPALPEEVEMETDSEESSQHPSADLLAVAVGSCSLDVVGSGADALALGLSCMTM